VAASFNSFFKIKKQKTLQHMKIMLARKYKKHFLSYTSD